MGWMISLVCLSLICAFAAIVHLLIRINRLEDELAKLKAAIAGITQEPK